MANILNGNVLGIANSISGSIDALAEKLMSDNSFWDSEYAKRDVMESEYPELAQELKDKKEEIVWGKKEGFGYFSTKASKMPLSCYVAIRNL